MSIHTSLILNTSTPSRKCPTILGVSYSVFSCTILYFLYDDVTQDNNNSKC